MSAPFLTEIRIFPFNFAPKGWAFCNGQLLAINQNQAMFSLIGTTYGGNGQTTFALPNLQGSVGMHMGSGFTLGQIGGEASHTLVAAELPAHTHAAMADTATGHNNTANPTGTYPANTGGTPMYSAGSGATVRMAPQMVSSVGGGQPHENRQPYLALNYCIALQGIFPSRN
jgi:microcystin-dependent protein